jgi:hypothetical protein
MNGLRTDVNGALILSVRGSVGCDDNYAEVALGFAEPEVRTAVSMCLEVWLVQFSDLKYVFHNSYCESDTYDDLESIEDVPIKDMVQALADELQDDLETYMMSGQ